MEAKLLDNPVAEAGANAITAVADAITAIPEHLAGRVDATSTDLGSALHVGDHNAISVTAKPSEMIRLEDQTQSTTDDFYSCAYTFGAEPDNISKMVRIHSGTWDISKSPGYVLARIDLPYAFYADNSFPAYGQTRYFKYSRAGYHFQLMLSAPLGYAGALLLLYAPRELAARIGRENESFDRYGLDFDTAPNLPHSIFSVSDNTEVTLTVPYMSSKNYAQNNFSVPQHSPPEGGAVFVVVLGELEAPSTSNNTLGFTVYGAMLDLDLQCPRVFGVEGKKTVKRVNVPMGIKPPSQARQIIQPGPGSWNAANSKVVDCSESMAIAGEATAIDYATAGVACAERDLVEVLQRWSIVGSTQWEGDKTATTMILSKAVDFNFGNFKQICKHFHYFRGSLEFKIVIYAPKSSQGRIQVSWYPSRNQDFTLAQARNSIYVVTDVGGPAPVLVCPFTSDTWRRDFSRYGTINVHVVNVFRSNVAAANKCTLQLWVRAGPDFKLYCPKRPSTNFDIPSIGDQAVENHGVSESMDNPTEPNVFLNFDRVNLDITSESHSKLSVLFGRPWFQNEYGPNTVATKVPLKLPDTGVPGLAHAYVYWTGEFSITIQTGRDPVIFTHSYADLGETIPLEDLMSNGAVFIPRYSFKTLRIPYYAKDPLRYTYDENGYLFLAMTNAQFLVKSPLPKVAARGAVIGTSYNPRGDAPNHIIESNEIERHLDSTISNHLLCSGDVETNPGPQLVYRDRGIYKHYGVRVGQKVFHTATENLVKTMVDGSVTVCETDFTPDWIVAGPETETMAQKYLQHGFLPSFKYSIDQNCESWARDMLSGDATSYQGSAIKTAMAMAVVLGFFTTVTYYENQGLFSSVTTFFQKITQLIYGGFECFIVKTVVKTVVKIICYLIMYAHSPNLLTTGVLATLLAIDCLNTELDPTCKKLVEALVEGKFSEVAKAILAVAKVEEEVPQINAGPIADLQDQGPKDFNDWSNVAKNCKWWFESLTHLFEWIKNKIFPPDLAEVVDELEENKNKMAAVFALADEHICNMMTDKTYAISQEAKEKHRNLVDMMSGTLDFLVNLPKNSQLYSRAAALMHRLQQINFEPTMDWCARPEPVGIWIAGDAGVGKSFLVKRIASELAKHYGWRVYSNPTGSNHMDGYTNQEVHLFDDFGQNREEEDYALICQLISSCPFIVPKADVTAKGTPYNARVVLVTTNRHDFTSKKLYDSEALKRRFPILLHIKPKEKYSVDGKINISLAMKTGDLMSGSCWQRNLKTGTALSSYPDWRDLDLSVLIKELIDEIDTRARVVSLMNQGKFDQLKEKLGDRFSSFKQDMEQKVTRKLRRDLFVSLEEPESFFDYEKLERTARAVVKNVPNQSKWEQCKFLINETIGKLKKYLEKHRVWIMAIGALGSVISIASLVIPWGKPKRQESIYDGSAPVRLTRDFKAAAEKHVAQIQRPVVNQGKWCFEQVTRRLIEVEDREGFAATALPLGGKDVITYGHDSFVQTVNGEKIVHAYNVTINNEPMDLQVFTIDTKTQYKQLNNLLHDEDYVGNGFLLWKRGEHYYVQPVSRIQPTSGFTTWNGTTTTFGYIYEAPTTIGSCGGVLVAPIGGNLKILGIHVAGNGVDGVAARLFKMFVAQGKVTSVRVHEKPLYHQPRKTAYHRSPFFDAPSVEPAVLSRNDPRLIVEIDDVTINAAKKYKGNCFNPPPACWDAARAKVMQNMRKVVKKCSQISYDAAVSGEIMPIDWKTSPGLKYSGKRKRDLVGDPNFKDDVFAQLEKPATTFVTYLKDELRPKEKVQIGKTRAIEACSFDFVIAFRMVCGAIYQQIYEDVACISGIAVGICPYTHWGTMMRRHRKYALCLDFSGFDGSLPPELLTAGVEICSTFHTNPEIVRAIHAPIIQSHHLVSTEEWEVDGGMCSGAPCTSVLNSICNNIAAYTVALACGGDLDSIHVTSYGDDIILSSDTPFDTTKVVEYYKIFFGMTATSAKKTDEIEWVPIEEATFLKRKTGHVDFFPMPVGVLDLQSMMDHIQWTKGHFDQQLDSFAFELVFHGEETYRKVMAHLERINSRITPPSYEEMRLRVKSLLYNQGKPTNWSAMSDESAALLALSQPGGNEGIAAIALYQDQLKYEQPGQCLCLDSTDNELAVDELRLDLAIQREENNYWMKEDGRTHISDKTIYGFPLPSKEESENILAAQQMIERTSGKEDSLTRRYGAVAAFCEHYGGDFWDWDHMLDVFDFDQWNEP
nr:MAG: polyprotein [Picornaviridae sp.]